jgi:hypothetical protein
MWEFVVGERYLIEVIKCIGYARFEGETIVIGWDLGG